MVTIEQLIDDAKCYEVVRKLRWLQGVRRLTCDSTNIMTVIANAIAGRRASNSLTI